MGVWGPPKSNLIYSFVSFTVGFLPQSIFEVFEGGNLSTQTSSLTRTKKIVGGSWSVLGHLSNTHVKHHITLARNSHTNVTWARDSHNSKVNELLIFGFQVVLDGVYEKS